jgi:asparagine synthase (glutamine-hydrolysing)
MCGIAGLVCPTTGLLETSFVSAIDHRGPDDRGYLLWSPEARAVLGLEPPEPAIGQVFLAHRRLSILDLSPLGRQPMGTQDGRYFITYNGEIYNYRELRAELEALGHRFRSQSDTEVLLEGFARWGSGVLPRLTGMFAFAVLDTKDRRLFVARDFFGIKPLYYAAYREGFAFASEIKALLRLPALSREADAAGVYSYLRFGLTDHGGGTLLRAIRQVPAAHFLEISLDRPVPGEPVRYWEPTTAEPRYQDPKEAAARLRELFLESVRLHLRSDVPVGAALSGGIDSSAIVCAIRHLEPSQELHVFSFVADDPAVSEESWAEMAAQGARATLHKVRIAPEELAADLDQLIAAQDEPFNSTSIYAQHRVMRLAKETGIKVMLDGQGADELFGGYQTCIAARLASLIRQGSWLSALSFWWQAGRRPTVGMRWLMERAVAALVPPAISWGVRMLLGDGRIPRWLEGKWFEKHGAVLPTSHETRRRELLLEQLAEMLERTMLPHLLRYEDRNSMAWSIESRVPFLTPDLATFARSMPEQFLITGDGTTKSVFRAAMRGLVPDAILDRKDKRGFPTPERKWLGALETWVEDTLRADATRGCPLLSLDSLLADWQAVQRARDKVPAHFWRRINFLRWADIHGVRVR